MMRGTLKSLLVWFAAGFMVFGPLGQALVWEPEPAKAAESYTIFGINDPDPSGSKCLDDLDSTGTDSKAREAFQQNWTSAKAGGAIVVSSYQSWAGGYGPGGSMQTYYPDNQYRIATPNISPKIGTALDRAVKKIKEANDKVKAATDKATAGREVAGYGSDLHNAYVEVQEHLSCQFKFLALANVAKGGKVNDGNVLDYVQLADVNERNMNGDAGRPCYFSAATLDKYMQSADGRVPDPANGNVYSIGHHDICAPNLKQFVTYYLKLKDLNAKALAELSAGKTLSATFYADGGLAAVQGTTAESVHDEDDVCKTRLLSSIEQKIRGALCSIVVAIHDTLVSLLGSSLNLMASTSGFSNFNADATTDDDWFESKDSKSKGLKELFQPLEQTMQEARSDGAKTQLGLIMRNGYQRVLQFLDSILIIIFFIVAIANILQIEVNKYSLKKLAPGFLWGFLAAHFSYFAVQVLLEFSGVLTRFILGFGEAKGSASTFATAFDLTGSVDKTTLLTYGQIFKVAFFNLFILFAIIIVLILAFMFLCRIVVFAVAVPLAPLAFFGLFFQPASNIWNRWWKTVSGWIFMPTAVAFCLWLAFMYASAASDVTTYGFIGQLLSYVIFVFLLLMAIKLPFSMAGEAKMVMDKWAGFGKWATSPVTGGVKHGAKMAGYGLLNNQWGFDKDGKPRGGIRGNAAWLAGAAGRGVGKGIRLKNATDKNRKEAEEEAKDRAFNGPIDPLAEKRRQAEKTVLNESLVKVKTREKNIDKLLEKEREQAAAGNAAAARAVVTLEAEKKNEALKRTNLEKQIKDSSDPKSWLEEKDRDLAKAKAQREGNKGWREGVAANLASEAKRELTDDDQSGYRQLMATTERLKEETGILDDVTQKMIKSKKNELQQHDEYLTQLRKRQISENSEMEKLESTRDIHFYESVREDEELLDKMVKADKGQEVRDKLKSGMANNHINDMVFDYKLHDKIAESIEAGEMDRARDLAGLLRNKEVSRKLLAGMGTGKLTSGTTVKDIKDAMGTFTDDGAEYGQIRRRVEVDFIKNGKDDAGIVAESGGYRGLEVEDYRKMLNIDYSSLSGKSQRDMAINHTALGRDLGTGNVRGEAAKELQESFRRAGFDDAHHPELHKFLTDMQDTSLNEGDYTKLGKNFSQSEAARKYGLHRDQYGSPDKLLAETVI